MWVYSVRGEQNGGEYKTRPAPLFLRFGWIKAVEGKEVSRRRTEKDELRCKKNTASTCSSLTMFVFIHMPRRKKYIYYLWKIEYLQRHHVKRKNKIYCGLISGTSYCWTIYYNINSRLIDILNQIYISYLPRNHHCNSEYELLLRRHSHCIEMN